MFTPLLDGARQPPALEYPILAATAIKKGGLVLVTAGVVGECGADPAEISGVTAHATGPDTSGFNLLANNDVPPLKCQFFAARGNLFLADYTGTLPTTLGGTYGVVKDGTSAEWQVDFGETTNTRVQLVAFGTANELGAARKRVVVKFHDADTSDLNP